MNTINYESYDLHLILFLHLSGFNGGSALAANLRAAQACIVTNLAASVGGLTWMLWVNPYILPLLFSQLFNIYFSGLSY